MADPVAVRYTGLPPARSFPFPAITGAGVSVINGAGMFMGYGIENTSAVAVARAVISDSGGTGVGTEIVPLTFAANESRLDTLTGAGVLFVSGLAITATLGTVAGALWAVLLTPDELRAVRAFSVALATE